jgi:hypothetical protein
MSLPQLVGLRCVCCHKAIGSVVEGLFCPGCGNPAHRDCLAPDRAPREGDGCARCGGDLQSPEAVEVRAELQRGAVYADRALVCPNCGSRSGFRPFRGDERLRRERDTGLLLLFKWLLLFGWLYDAGTTGELQCFKCDYVFRPRSRAREVGCIVLVVLAFIGLLALSILPRL